MKRYGPLVHLATASKGSFTASAYVNTLRDVFLRITPGVQLDSEDLTQLMNPGGAPESVLLRLFTGTVSLYEFPKNMREGETAENFEVQLGDLVAYLDGVEEGTYFD